MEQVQAYTEEELAKMDWAFEKSGGPSEELFTHVEYSVLGTSVSQEMIDTFKAARAIVLDNAPAGMPTMFLRGKDTSEYMQFLCIGDVSDAIGVDSPAPAMIGVTLDESRFVTPISLPDTVYDFIRYNTIQYLAAEQKKRARANIDVKSATELSTDTTLAALRYVAQTLTEAQKMQARENIGVPSPAELASNEEFLSIAVPSITRDPNFTSSILNNDELVVAFATSALFIQALLGDASFIAQLKTKLGI